MGLDMKMEIALWVFFIIGTIIGSILLSIVIPTPNYSEMEFPYTCDREYNRGYGDALYLSLQRQQKMFGDLSDKPFGDDPYHFRNYSAMNNSIMCDQMGTGHMKCQNYSPPRLCNCTGRKPYYDARFDAMMNDLVTHCICDVPATHQNIQYPAEQATIIPEAA